MDLNRGVTQKGNVYMYKDAAGVGRYYMGDDVEVPEALAKAAGFDVNRLGIERQILDGQAEAERKLAAMDYEEPEVKEAEGQFELIQIGIGMFNVRHAGTGKTLFSHGVAQEMAESTFRAATALDDEEEVPATTAATPPPESSEEVILANSGKPFASHRMAEMAAEKKNLHGARIVEVEGGGFGIAA